MKVCLFGSYDRDYARNASAIAAIKTFSETVECNAREKKFPFSAVRLFFAGMKCDFDIMWVCYPGHLDMLAAKAVCMLKRKPLAFDLFISKFDAETEYGLIEGGAQQSKRLIEKHGMKQFSRKSFHARLLHSIDALACRLADRVFLDTAQHAQFIAKEFSVPEKKLSWFFVGANESAFKPAAKRRSVRGKKFRVLFYGNVTPMHGFPHIVEAARILEGDKDIEFEFVGANLFFREERDRKGRPANAKFSEAVPLQELARKISEADACLGIFGETPKARRVIPNKVFEAMAMAKPLITMRSDAVSGVLADAKNALLVDKGNAGQIADAVRRLKNDPALAEKIAGNARRTFEEKFSSEKIGAKIKRGLEAVVKK
ncbi:MAG: glycosyltransferase [Candidatus Diapherotrites archaeon]|nr:glycosyltransferase [Candidatus Diapherotrites archaeon]